MTSFITSTPTLRAVIERRKFLVMPGGYSPVYARMAEECGFEAFFLAGSKISSFLFGVPDVGLIGLRDVAWHAHIVAQSTSIPLLVDGDTGYGNAVSVHFAVREFAHTGAGGVQFEDQEAPKKTGTGKGRRCVSIAEAVGKYQAAVAARDETDPEFVICARCDAIGAEGESFESAVVRCRAYVEDGGADMVWLNSPQSLEQIEEICRAVPAPVFTAWGRPGPTPSAEQFESLGLVGLLLPTITANVGAQATWELLHELRASGLGAVDAWNEATENSPWGVQRNVDFVGLSRVPVLEESYLPDAMHRDYESTYGSMQGRGRPS